MSRGESLGLGVLREIIGVLDTCGELSDGMTTKKRRNVISSPPENQGLLGSGAGVIM